MFMLVGLSTLVNKRWVHVGKVGWRLAAHEGNNV